MAVGNPFARSQGFNYISDNKYLQDDFTGSTPLDFSNLSSSGIMSQAPVALKYIQRDGVVEIIMMMMMTMKILLMQV